MLKTLNHPGAQCNHECRYTFLFSSIAWKVFFFFIIISTGFASAQLPAFYVGTNGDDNASGTTAESAWRTIQHALNTVNEGSTVYILPGTYREELQIKTPGVSLVSMNGPGTVHLYASLPASGMTWTRLSAGTTAIPDSIEGNVWWTELSDWVYEPLALYQITADGVRRLPRSRAPNWCAKDDWMASQNGWQVASETYKYVEKWWRADPTMSAALRLDDIDVSYLIDKVNDSWTDAGNLQSFDNLIGGRVCFLDGGQGYYEQEKMITSYDKVAGRISWGHQANINNGLHIGRYSRYYLTAHPELLDLPGEWWYDTETKRLYLYPAEGGNVNPATLNIEIPRFNTVIALNAQDNTLLDGLVIRYGNVNKKTGEALHAAINQEGNKGLTGITIKNCTIEHCARGLTLWLMANATESIQNVTLENCIFGYHDNAAVTIQNKTNNPLQINNITIRDSEFHRNGFKDTFGKNAIRLERIGNLIFEGNHVHHNAHNGLVVTRRETTLVDVSLSIRNNLFEWNAMKYPDAGGLNLNYLKGYREILVNNNVSRYQYGYSFAQYEREQDGAEKWNYPNGYSGHGFYLDINLSGVEMSGNKLLNNSHCGVRENSSGANVYYQNLFENLHIGINLSGTSGKTRISNNQFNNISETAINISGDTVGMYVDYDRFQDCTNLLRLNGPFYKTLNNVRQNTPYEQHGAIGPPLSTQISKLDVIQVLNNPYQGVGEVEFTNLPAGARLSIYSIRGELIKNLSAYSSIGAYTWNGRNEKGDAVNPGIYIARISESDDHRAIKIMVLRP